MCEVVNGKAELCPWGRRLRTRREILPYLLTTNMRPSEIERALGRRLDGTRTSAVQVRYTRMQAELHGCLKPRAKTCPDCPPDKPTPTPLGGRCTICQERHHLEDRRRYHQREATGIPARTDGFLPPMPLEQPRFPLGSTWYGPRRPSHVPLPVPPPRECPAERLPSFPRARCESAAWSRPSSPMEA